MNSSRLRCTAIGTLSIIWLNVVIPLIKDNLGIGVIIFPRPLITETQIHLLLISSILLVISIFSQALIELSNISDVSINKSRKKLVPLTLVMLMSVPFVFGYVFDQGFQSVGQMILDIGTTLMEETFDDLPPGTDPPGWDTNDGNWATVYDDGNIVYYQDDNSDKESLSISTTGNSNWTD